MEIFTIKVGVDNCYIIKDKGIILIDGGMSGEFQSFSNEIDKLGLNPKSIEAIIITHCHWDHIGCTKKIKEMTGAKVIVHKNEANILEKGELSIPPSVTLWGKTLGILINSMCKKITIDPCIVDIIIDGDYSLEKFGINGKIFFTPGHSDGSISVVLDSGNAFVGDMAINQFPLSIRPNLPIFGNDMSILKTSWKKLINQGIKNIHPAHGKNFPVEKIIKRLDI